MLTWSSHSRARGMTLIELMVGLAILAFLVVLGAPSFSSWIQNIRVRAAADGVLAGIQTAKTEAVTRNARVRFQLTTTAANGCALTTVSNNWVVNIDSNNDPNEVVGLCGAAPYDDGAPDAGQEPRILQRRGAAESAGNIVTNASASSVVFNGLGRVVFPPGVGAGNLVINFTAPAPAACAPAGEIRCLRVVVTPAGQVRMCDPIAAAGDPTAC